MKILEIKIVDNKLVINTDNNGSVNSVYVDTLDNKCNKYSDNAEEHSYTFTELIKTDRGIEIDLDKFKPELDTSAFTVLVNNALGFYYDTKELYYNEVELLTNHCSTCLDNHQKNNMVLFILNKQLLDYATVNGLVEDQINFYESLARMLKIDLISNCISSDCKCKNGVCKVC